MSGRVLGLSLLFVSALYPAAIFAQDDPTSDDGFVLDLSDPAEGGGDLAAPVEPPKPAEPLEPIAKSLGPVKWGMSSAKAKSIISEEVMGEYRSRTNGAGDLSYADNLRKAYQDRVEAMSKSYIELKSDNVANLSVSVVGEEFVPDNGESMLTARWDDATRYYFFKDDRLYKIVVVYDGEYFGGIAFDTFVGRTEKKYGRAAEENWSDDGDFTDALWKDSSGVDLRVKNRYSSYNTFLLVYSDGDVERSLADAHEKYFKKVNSGPAVSSAIDALTEDDGDIPEDSLDALLGRKTDVDLLSGLSQRDIDIINGVGKQEEAEPEEQKKTKARKESKKKAKSKPKGEIEF